MESTITKVLGVSANTDTKWLKNATIIINTTLMHLFVIWQTETEECYKCYTTASKWTLKCTNAKQCTTYF